jgi:hypothetical protein
MCLFAALSGGAALSLATIELPASKPAAAVKKERRFMLNQVERLRSGEVERLRFLITFLLSPPPEPMQ